MMTQRKRLLLIVVAIILIVGFIFIVIASRSTKTNTTSSPVSTLTYTNAITRQKTADNLAENGQQIPSLTLPPTSVNISGFQNVYNFLSNEQGSNLQTLITNFLMARSGLANVTAGIKNNTITHLDDQTIQFTLVVVRPQISYIVSVQTANQFQSIPNVTFEQVDGL